MLRVCLWCWFWLADGFQELQSMQLTAHNTIHTTQIHQKIHKNDLKMAAKHPKIGIFEKFNKQQAVKVKVSKGLS